MYKVTMNNLKQEIVKQGLQFVYYIDDLKLNQPAIAIVVETELGEVQEYFKNFKIDFNVTLIVYDSQRKLA